MTHQLNYCRQLAKFLAQELASDALSDSMRKLHEMTVYACKESTKFLLPDGGRIIDDPCYRAIEVDERLSLPFPMIALEYEVGGPTLEPGMLRSTKRIAFAIDEPNHSGILFWSAAFIDKQGGWIVFPPVMLNRKLGNSTDGQRGAVINQLPEHLSIIPVEDYRDELHALLSTLNALRCSNVTTEETKPRSWLRAGKGAIPFDSYHILTLRLPKGRSDGPSNGGSHASPREHLRRGHIRRLESGARIWINATLVNPGAAGKVLKDYRLSH